jgi:2-polyprenyl-6-methoxyphenol hydroxylase-like FAD-dependent oxidoreductase
MSPPRHAAVIGASFAGLCAARVLADFFERVTILERDALPRGSEDGRERPGVPQGRHVHVLLARGAMELERLHPGFRAEAIARGAIELDMGLEAAFLRVYGWAPRLDFGVPLLLASRWLFEATVRERSLAIPGIEVRDRTTVIGLSRAAERVDGVLLAADGGHSRLDADLVVDASGRASKAAQWLAALGVTPPEETVVDGLWGYSTRWYRAPARLPDGWWWRAIIIEGRPPEVLRGGVLIPVEDARWMVTLGGASGDYPPTDEAGFNAALAGLRSPLIAQAVALARPISPIYGSRTMSNHLRHYERWLRPLAGFIAVGDAVCAFNPIYGQGMTTAALCAAALGDALRRTRGDDLPATFFSMQARAQSDAWSLATGADLRLQKTIGDRPLSARLLAPYFDALLLATRNDGVVYKRFFEVLQMLQPLSSLFAPGIVARVAAHALCSLVGSGKEAPAPIPDRQVVTAA